MLSKQRLVRWELDQYGAQSSILIERAMLLAAAGTPEFTDLMEDSLYVDGMKGGTCTL